MSLVQLQEVPLLLSLARFAQAAGFCFSPIVFIPFHDCYSPRLLAIACAPNICRPCCVTVVTQQRNQLPHCNGTAVSSCLAIVSKFVDICQQVCRQLSSNLPTNVCNLMTEIAADAMTDTTDECKQYSSPCREGVFEYDKMAGQCFRDFPLCQRQNPAEENLPFAGWWRLEAKPLTSYHPANGKGILPLTLTQSFFSFGYKNINHGLSASPSHHGPTGNICCNDKIPSPLRKLNGWG